MEELNKKISEIESELESLLIRAREKASSLKKTREEKARKLVSKYSPFIGKKVFVKSYTSEYSYKREVIGYLLDIVYLDTMGYVMIMSKVKKDGSQSKLRYTPFESANAEHIEQINLV